MLALITNRRQVYAKQLIQVRLTVRIGNDANEYDEPDDSSPIVFLRFRKSGQLLIVFIHRPMYLQFESAWLRTVKCKLASVTGGRLIISQIALQLHVHSNRNCHYFPASAAESGDSSGFGGFHSYSVKTSPPAGVNIFINNSGRTFSLTNRTEPSIIVTLKPPRWYPPSSGNGCSGSTMMSSGFAQ